MRENNPFPQNLLDVVRKLSANATEKANALNAEADNATRIQKLWEDLASFLTQGWPLHILDLMEKEKPFLEKMRADNHVAIPSLEEIYQIAKEQAEVLQRRFPAYLEEACAAKLPLDRESRHPRYSFAGGFFQLEVNDRKRTARLFDHEGQLAEFPADIEAVVETVQSEHKRVFGRPFEGKRFLKKLRNQYLAIVKKENQSDGTSIPIRHITRRLGKNEKGFRTDEFLVDLSRLVELGPMEIDGWRLDLQQTKDTNQGMLLHGIAGRSYIGFITFKKV